MSQSLRAENTQTTQKLEKWFDEFISAIQIHELQLATDTASKGIKRVYDLAMSENTEGLAHLGKIHALQYFVGAMITKYLGCLDQKLPIKLAVDFNDSEVLIWAEIETNDDEMEKQLYLAEAKVNAYYHKFGYDVTTTIVEVDDSQEVPGHYKKIKTT